MFKKTNLNPSKTLKSDCVVRAIAKALPSTWEKTYLDLVMEGYAEYNMPSANEVWDGYLRKPRSDFGHFFRTGVFLSNTITLETDRDGAFQSKSSVVSAMASLRRSPQ